MAMTFGVNRWLILALTVRGPTYAKTHLSQQNQPLAQAGQAQAAIKK
jgi:hypothetical protein